MHLQNVLLGNQILISVGAIEFKYCYYQYGVEEHYNKQLQLFENLTSMPAILVTIQIQTQIEIQMTSMPAILVTTSKWQTNDSPEPHGLPE